MSLRVQLLLIQIKQSNVQHRAPRHVVGANLRTLIYNAKCATPQRRSQVQVRWQAFPIYCNTLNAAIRVNLM